MPTITAIINGEMKYATSDEEIAEVVRAVFAEPRSGWAARLFAWHGQRPYRKRKEGPPASQLRIVADLGNGWGAVNFLRRALRHNGWDGWNSFNPDLPADAPDLPFGNGHLAFPRSASIPLDAAAEAVREYCHHGRRPKSVKWQEARYF